VSYPCPELGLSVALSCQSQKLPSTSVLLATPSVGTAETVKGGSGEMGHNYQALKKLRDAYPEGMPWGTFNEWRRFIAGILQAAGVKGFLGNLAELQEGADPEVLAWARLLAYWHGMFEGQAVSVKELFMSLNGFGLNKELPRSLVESLDRAAGESCKVTRLSRAIDRIKGRYLNDEGLRIEQADRDGHQKVNPWRIVTNAPSLSPEVS